MSPEQAEFQNQTSERAGQLRGDIEQAQAQQFDLGERAFTPYDVRMSGALTNKYRRALGERMSMIRAERQLGGITAQSKALQMAQQREANRLRMETENLERVLNAQRQREAARAQVIGSLLGAAGTAAGFAIGGPMGASAGGNMGRQAGSMSGGGAGFQNHPDSQGGDIGGGM
jgi:hypothetical protein